MQMVARRAGGSISTVSRVLSREVSVDSVIRERVETAAADLGYSKARDISRKPKGMRLLSLIIRDISNPFFLPLLDGIERTARLHGYNVLLCGTDGPNNLDEDGLRELMGKGVEGIVYLESTTLPAIDVLVGEGFPVVLLDRPLDGREVSYVDSANEDGAYQAIAYLLKLGHRRISFIFGPRNLETANQRFVGYKRALSEFGIEFDEDLVIDGEYKFDVAKRNMAALIQRGIPFTAVFSSNDLMAFGAKSALEERGRHIPDDVSLVGYDDIRLSSAIGLTTVSQPTYEMGRNAVILLIDLISGRLPQAANIILNANLVIRGSCGKPRD